MRAGCTVGDLMQPVNALPSITAEAPLRQAIEVLLGFQEATGAARPTLVVLDGARFVGVVTQRDLLMALEPDYLKPAAHAQGAHTTDAELTLIWESLFAAREAKDRLMRPVGEVMRRVVAHVTPGDPVVKAAWLMIHEDLPVLPVQDGARLVGVLRMKETFGELMRRLLA